MIERRAGFYGIVIGIILLSLVQAEVTRAARPKATRWLSSFDAAQTEARRLNRPVIVHFYADWCQPCKRMERETLQSQAFLRQITGRFIAVRINSDKHPKLVKRYNVTALPADVFLDPGGRILARQSGYQNSRQYLARVAHVDAAFAKQQKTIIARKQTTAPPPGAAAKPTDDRPPAPAEASPTKPTPSIAHKPDSRTTVGMGGYSPVALWNHRKWVEGKVEFAARHQGITFYLASRAELRQFRAAPDRYAPRLLGCDPVVLNETDRALAGNIDFGAYFDGELFFFVSDASRKKFRAHPLRYTRTRHVLKIDRIDGVIRR